MGRVEPDAKPDCDPSKPLANIKHERFCWAIVQGHRLGPAHEIAGFSGKSPRLPWQLRHQPSVDARIRWLLAERVEANARAAQRTEEKIGDARLRLIRELERIAYSDIRDVIQWDADPVFDDDGNVTGERPVMKITPSRLLTREQATQVRAVTTKSGGLRFEVHDKLGALAQLARILGLVKPEAAPASSTTFNTQVNVGGGAQETMLDAARRLAFAIEKAARAQPKPTMIDVTPAQSPGEGLKG